MSLDNNFKRYPLFSPLICGIVDTDYYDEDTGELLDYGTYKLCPFEHNNYYHASTWNYRCDCDSEEATLIFDNRKKGYVYIPTPCLVLLLRYLHYGPHGWSARVLFAGREVNVDPGMLLPLDTPRDFGWEEFKKGMEAFNSPEWANGFED